MMIEKESFLVESNSRNRSQQWEIWKYYILSVLLFILILPLFIRIHNYSNELIGENTIIQVISTDNKTVGLRPVFKGVGKDYEYESLPACDTVKLPNKFNKTAAWLNKRCCGNALLQRFFGNPESLLPNFVNVLYVCDDTEEMEGFKVKELKNSKRSYFVALPKCRDPEHILLNFGISEDTTAEKQLKATIPNLKMYATSPTQMKSQIYDHLFIGSVENKITSEKNATDQATPLEKYLSAELKNTKFIDIIWINLSQGPFDLFQAIKENSAFNNSNLTICQISVEVRVDDYANFYSFMLAVLEGRTYFFMRPTTSDDNQFVRVILLNVANERCYIKYYF
uniref:Glycosyltransferase family 92 protein n=1 Tax=Caenorhabditis japonica TaxID=281687 RepID=A0A8R1I2T6_CAEJA